MNGESKIESAVEDLAAFQQEIAKLKEEGTTHLLNVSVAKLTASDMKMWRKVQRCVTAMDIPKEEQVAHQQEVAESQNISRDAFRQFMNNVLNNRNLAASLEQMQERKNGTNGKSV